jgi:multiple sugar transport system substrate-binding protein
MPASDEIQCNETQRDQTQRDQTQCDETQPMTLRGMTWAHPRATQPLAAFARARPDLPHVDWNAQPLAALEARPVSEWAQEYDLLVIDHPGLGAAVTAKALVPLDELFDRQQLAGWEQACIGRTWGSYRYLERQWAVPIDASTQVSVLGAGLTDAPPRRWDEVPAFAASHPTALCLASPHAGLTLMAMAHSESATDSILDPAVGIEALELLKSVWPLVDQATSLLDPIAVHQAIASAEGPVYCPLAYGYATYAPAVHWANAPGFQTGRPASVLGGTGLAVSALTGADRDEVRAYVTAYLDPSVQNHLVPAAGGQPATTAAWYSPEVDRTSGGFYSATIESVLTAWVRPRNPGWIPFQDTVSGIVRDTIAGAGDSATAIARINALYVAEGVRT